MFIIVVEIMVSLVILMAILVPPFNRCQDDFEYSSEYFHYLHFNRWQQWRPVNKNEKILKVGVGNFFSLEENSFVLYFACQSLKVSLF